MSAVITLVIVVMWAVVLVPMWLRRHDRAAELTSVDRFAGAMKVLSRRSGGTDRRWVVMPARAERVRRPQVSGVARTTRPGRSAAAAPVASRQVQRRRRTLGVLSGAVVGTALLALVAGGSFTFLQVLCDLLLLAGLIRTRMMVADERRRRAVHLARARRQAGRMAAVLEAGRSARPEPGHDWAVDPGEGRPAEPAVQRWPEPVAPAPAAQAEAVAAPRVATQFAPVLPAQRPVAVAFAGPSRPVRISSDPATAERAPVSGRPVPIVDLTRPGAWSEGRLLEDNVGDVEIDDQELTDILERRRAVNG